MRLAFPRTRARQDMLHAPHCKAVAGESIPATMAAPPPVWTRTRARMLRPFSINSFESSYVFRAFNSGLCPK